MDTMTATVTRSKTSTNAKLFIATALLAGSVAFAVIPAAFARPDLSISNVTITQGTNGNYNYSLNLANTGQRGAENFFVGLTPLNADNSVISGSIESSIRTSGYKQVMIKETLGVLIPNIQKKSKITIRGVIAQHLVSGGMVKLKTYADVTRIISETNETNNEAVGTVPAPTASLQIQTIPIGNETVVSGADDVLLYRGTLEAGSHSDVTISSLIAGAAPNSSEWDQLLNTMKLYISRPGSAVNIGTDLVAVDSMLTDEQAFFNDFSYTVNRGAANRVFVEIHGDIDEAAAAGTVKVQVTDIGAEDVEENDVTMSPAVSVSDRLVTISSGTLSIKIDTNYTGLRNDHYVLTGSRNRLVGRIEVKATGEDIKLKDLVVTLSGSSSSSIWAADNTLQALYVYGDSAMTQPLAMAEVTNQPIVLEDIDYTVPVNTTKHLYLGLDVSRLGDGAGPSEQPFTVAFGLTDAGTTAVGGSSNTDLDPIVVENVLTKNMTFLAAQVISVASNFSGGNIAGGEQTFFTFAVTADAGENTDRGGDSLHTYLTGLKLQLASDVGAGSVTNTKLCRVSTGNCIPLQLVTPLTASNITTQLQTATDGYVNMTAFANADDRRVDSNETVLYEVRATFSNTTDKFVQGSVQDVDAGGVVWGYNVVDNAPSPLTTTFSDLKKMEPRPSGYPDITSGTLN